MLYTNNAITGIGKISVNISGLKERNVVMPSLHFIVFKTETGFESFCLEFQLSSFSSSDRIAIEQLCGQVSAYVKALFSKSPEEAKRQILNRISERNVDDYWVLYRETTFKLGLSGIETDSNAVLFQEIELLKKKIAFLERVKDSILENRNKGISSTGTIETSNEYEYNKISA